MTIAAGAKLGPYEILSPLGAGGMGEVYRARDTRLGRDVAVKILPASFSADSDRLHRFEQEACAAGALNHPNILIVHDIGTHDGSPYVVSELLEGETLRKRTGGTALAQRRAIDYALQVALGLAAAHEKGIVHRDLKPDNIFVTKDGRVKILDFGLAKLTQADGSQSQTEIPTRRVDTDPGIVMGTVGYMSPEQVRGKPVDHRSDIFSFGAILYEMLSGRRAFHGESAADTMSAILKEDPPDLSETNQRISPGLERLVNHCLEKNPEERFHSARDLAFALEALSGSTSVSTQTATVQAIAPQWIRRHALIAWIVAAVAILLVVALAIPYFRRAPTIEAPASRFNISPPEKGAFLRPVTISPDGRRIIFQASVEGKVQLWVRTLDSLNAQPLPGTENAIYPFWSPDSRSIAFFVQGKLKKMDIAGGPAQTLCDAVSGRGGTWNREGVIVFAPSSGTMLFRVSATGGAPMPVTTLDSLRKEAGHIWPCFLPDGRHFLYLGQSTERENTGIYVGSLDSNETKRLVSSDASAVYAPPGYLLFMRERTLMAQGFDANKLQLTGDAAPIAEQIIVVGPTRFGAFSVSDNGVLLYQSGVGLGNLQLTWFDRAGKQLATVGLGGIRPCLSPDEKRVAVDRADPQTGNSDIWLLDLTRGGASTRFTLGPGNNRDPVWSPDGSRIVFLSERDGPNFNLYQKPASGAANDELLLRSNDVKVPTGWSLDGRFILYQIADPKTLGDIWVLPLFGDQKPFPFLQTNFSEGSAQFSPDGHWIAYVSDDSGKQEVYVQSFPTSGSRWPVSTGGGVEPHWSRDGKEIFYLAPDRKLMAVEVKSESNSFEVGVPKPLFETRIREIQIGLRNNYVVAADGQRFLMTVPAADTAPAPLTVVLNWTAGLKK